MLKRIWPKLEHMPIHQAAYQGGRDTTEQVFSIKVLCEKAITTPECTVQLLSLDMSKAFDTVEREKLIPRVNIRPSWALIIYLFSLMNPKSRSSFRVKYLNLSSPRRELCKVTASQQYYLSFALL